MADQLSSIVSRLESVTTRLESVAARSGAGGGGGGAVSEEDAPFVKAFDEILKGPFQQYLDSSKKIGGDVQGHAELVKKALDQQRAILLVASKSKKPSQADLAEVLKPMTDSVQDVEAFKNRASSFANHLAAIASSIWAFGWVAVSPTPGPHVKEQYESSQFYINRVLKDFKEKDQAHVEWTRSWLAALRELQAYIKDNHTTGLSWNPQGGDAKQAKVQPKAAAPAPPAPPPAGGPPPPPPPPPADLFDEKPDDNKKVTDALFADLNKGSDITSGLKKVSKDEMTHKNPGLRLQGPQPYKPAPNPKPVGAAFGVKKVESVKPPKCALEGKKWVVENQMSNKNLVISDTNNKQTVYIYKCDNSTIQVKGKVNSITMDTCKKTALVFEDVIASMDVINSQSVQTQVTGKVHTINIDKTDGCLIYLSQDSIKADIIAAKSSEMNILVPDASGEFKEFALPEQYRSVWNGTKFVTEPTDVVG